jgi:hypothetical protein
VKAAQAALASAERGSAPIRADLRKEAGFLARGITQAMSRNGVSA